MFLNVLLIILASIGAIVVLLILGFIALRWYLIWRLRRLGEQFADRLQYIAEQVADASDPPLTVTELDEDQLADDTDAQEAIAALRRRGFVDAGFFGCGTASGVGLASSEHAAYASVTRLFQGALVIDLVTPYTDGTWITYSTIPATGVIRPPDMPIVRLQHVSCGEVLDRFLAERPGKPFRRVRPDLFFQTYNEYLEKERLWRSRQQQQLEGR